MTDCAGWPEGADGDTANNTTHCRLYHAGVAADDPATHCPHASADGGGVCVDDDPEPTLCEAYCAAVEMNCTGDNALMWTVDCATDCAGWPEGAEGDTGNNTTHCRLYHAEVAGTDEIKFWLMTWGSKAEVLAPAALRDEMISEAESMLQTYQG